MPKDFHRKLEKITESQGFLFLGVGTLGEEPEFPRFQQWLKDEKHAGMSFLENHQACRKDNRLVMPEGRSAILIGSSYFLGDTLNKLPSPSIAQYARSKDYHKALRKKLEEVIRLGIQEGILDSSWGFRIFVDSAPVLERALAARNSRGFIGKNTLFILPDKGSFIFLSAIGIDQALPPTPQKEKIDPTVRTELGGCGTCKRCQVFCPTGALDQAYSLDARKCIAYFTIEHRGTIPIEFWKYLKHYFFGCDICQLVCPYNRKLEVRDEQRKLEVLKPHDINLVEIALMDQDYYERSFGGTPLTRAKIQGLKRNAFISLVMCSPKSKAIASIVKHFLESEHTVLVNTAKQYQSHFLNKNCHEV